MIEENQSLFMKMRPELDKLSVHERIAFAFSVAKYALVKLASFDVNDGKQKAVDIGRFQDICNSFAEDVKGFPADIKAFSEKAERRS